MTESLIKCQTCFCFVQESNVEAHRKKHDLEISSNKEKAWYARKVNLLMLFSFLALLHRCMITEIVISVTCSDREKSCIFDFGEAKFFKIAVQIEPKVAGYL